MASSAGLIGACGGRGGGRPDPPIRLDGVGVMTADRPSTYTPKSMSLPGKRGSFRMVTMLVPLRRFRTTGATAIVRTARRRGLVPRFGRALVGAAVHCSLACAAPASIEPAGTTAGRMLAAGDAAAERGWFAAARDHWRAAAGSRAPADSTAEQLVAARMARLAAVEQELDTAVRSRDSAAAVTWAATDWPVAWRVSTGPTACVDGAGSPPLTIVGELAVWNTGRAVHAVAVSDGRPRWSTADDRDTCIFPRGLGGPPSGPDQPCTLPPMPVAAAAGRVYATLDQGRAGHLLACLDLSDAAEGRLAWSARAADAARPDPRVAVAAFDGPPTSDHELCCAVVRADDSRGSLALAAFDARDGSPRWVRGLGPAVAVDGVDPARGQRQPCFAEDRIVVDTHAGRIQAFDRDGATVWSVSTSGPAADPAGRSCISPARFARGRVLVTAADGSTIAAIDPRDGRVVWRWRAADSTVADVVGTATDGLLIATRENAAATVTLRRLAIADGRETAAFSAEAVASVQVGPAAIDAGTIFWPVRHPAAAADGQASWPGLTIEVLDASTLDRRRPAVDCGPVFGTADAGDPTRPLPRPAVGRGSLLIAVDGMTCLRPASTTSRPPAGDASQQ